MGGHPPLGYDVEKRRLVVNRAEAAAVKRIFSDYTKLRSTTEMARTLAEEGITTKVWTTRDGTYHPGTPIDKKYLHKLLRNRIYRGELSYQGSWYPGQHEAIIDQELWNDVQAIHAEDAKQRTAATKIRSRTDALLRSLLYDPQGERMHPTYTRKNGRQYRYYISKAEMRFGASAKTYERIPAEEVEAAAVAQIKTILSSPEAIVAVGQAIKKNGADVDEAAMVLAMTGLGDVWAQLFPVEQHRIVNLMIERVDLVTGGLKIKWRELGWKELITEFAPHTIGAEMVALEAVA
jgi:hypothetical protein